ncbi:hypothetical protein [uncultured Hymenobacter sp.]
MATDKPDWPTGFNRFRAPLLHNDPGEDHQHPALITVAYPDGCGSSG